MSMTPGQLVPLLVEKPAAGGRMIARVDRQVVLVSGAIPGERLTALLEDVHARHSKPIGPYCCAAGRSAPSS